MPDEKKISLIIGKRGSGKSYLVKQRIAQERRLVVFDIMSEYNQGVVFERENIEVLCRFWKNVYRKDFRIIYRPIRPKEEIDYLAQLVFALGDVTFVVEEIDSICTAYDLPDTFSQIIQRGRHKNITLIGITPAPFGIHRDLTRQAKEICIFNTNEPRDIQYLKGLLGEGIEAKLNELKQYQFVKWTDGKEGFEIERA